MDVTDAIRAILLFVCFVGYNGIPDCDDFLMPDVCQAYYDFGQCFLYQARRDCRKTCKVCGDGWSTWSSWGLCSSECNGTRTRDRYCLSSPVHCPGDDLTAETCSRDGAVCDGSEEGSGTGDGEGLLPEQLLKHVCSPDTLFRCEPDSDVCLENELICDGYADCPNGFDEDFSSCPLALISNSSFQIKNELMQVCFEVITDDPKGPIDGVRGYRRCPYSLLSPVSTRYRWRWWKSYHLLNLHSGMCLTANDPRKASKSNMRVEHCKEAIVNQMWMCDNHTGDLLLVRPREIRDDSTPRFINLGDDGLGWPLVFSLNGTDLKSMWHKGPIEPPESICHKLQIHWADWHEWTDCTLTCGSGIKKRSRICVNGKPGIPPCEGSATVTDPCNRNISCKKIPGLHHNSKCRNSYTQLDNEIHVGSKEVHDPACYKTSRLQEPKSFLDARASCTKQRSFLGSMKTEESKSILVELLRNDSLSEAYIGVEENYTYQPVQGHQLHFSYDNTPVGSFLPWKTDCVLGAGFGYEGMESKAYVGRLGKLVECQSWGSNSPHPVKYMPASRPKHNHCRNPNLDPQGPWCYTQDPDIEWAYCDIPHCSELLSPTKLSTSYFYITSDAEGIYHMRSKKSQEKELKKKRCLTAAGTKKYTPSGAPSAKWLKLQKCKTTKDGSIQVTQRFVWDLSKRRLLHEDSMMCIAATSGEAGSSVGLEFCRPESVTQRWKAEGGMLYLDHFYSKQNVHMDAAREDLFVGSMGFRAWSASRAGSYAVDWGGLRKAYSEEAFELYNYPHKLCLTIDTRNETITEKYTLYAGDRVELETLPCKATPRFLWMRFPASPNMILHIQTSLCLTAAAPKEEEKLYLHKCDIKNVKQKWRCTGRRGQNIALQSNSKLVATITDHGLELTSSPTSYSYWVGWGTKMRTVCQFEVGSGGIPTGSKFAMRNTGTADCIQPDSVGSIVMKECEKSDSKENEIWSFTRAPTMIRHVKSGRCLRATAADGGSPIMVYKCNTKDILQHWTLFRVADLKVSWGGHPHYGIHLVVNLGMMIVVDSKTGQLSLKDGRGAHWTAAARGGEESPISTMTDCVVHTSTGLYYTGKTSVTKKGNRCIAWAETRYGVVFPNLEENYCRNPGRATMEPWCFTEDFRGLRVRESCDIPACKAIVIKIDSAGKWIPSTGAEKLPYICQSEPECYRGVGEDYIGSWNATRKGYCAPWKDHKESGFEANYCRNPNKDEDGPWCYLSRTKTIKETCPMPQCHETCANIPRVTYQYEIIRHTFSASVHGAEDDSTVAIQCRKGFWVERNKIRSDTTCKSAEWQPEPAACKVITCAAIKKSVKGALLSSASAALYDHYAIYVCTPGMLAGPAKSNVLLRCNELGEWEDGENQEKRCSNPCDHGWVPFRSQCFKTEKDETHNFDDAMEFCESLDANMADIEDEVEYNFLKGLVLLNDTADEATYWLGIKNIPDPKKSDLTYRDFKSVNYLDRVDKDRGAGYLPMLENSFKIMLAANEKPPWPFSDILPYSKRCLFGYDHTANVIARSCPGYESRRLLWRWVTPFHLYHVGTKKCLAGTYVNGPNKPDFEATATLSRCDRNDKQQYITCRRNDEPSMKLRFQENSFFADDVRNQHWDQIVIGGEFYGGNYSHWMIDKEGRDPCHWSVTWKGNVFLLWEGTQAEGKSYTSSEAEKICTENGGRLAKKEEVERKMETEDISACSCAWIAGNQLVSVNRQKSAGCATSQPAGVKVCSGQSKGDALCFRGKERNALDMPLGVILLLRNVTTQGTQERIRGEKHKVICRKESKWHCSPPPLIPRADLMETPATSYSYLGMTTYQCKPGYWFERGVFSKVVRCNNELQWEPDPADLSCEPLDCPRPSDIVNANVTVHSTDLHGKANYKCLFGYQFRWSIFEMEITCQTNAFWNPSPSSLQCTAVTCQSPEAVEFASHVSYSLMYPYNTTYTCEKGYWFRPNTSVLDSTCSGDGLWRPDPKKLRCREIVCPAPAFQLHVTWIRESIKVMHMRCENGYRLLRRTNGFNDTWNGTMNCLDTGRWHPSPEEYSCQAGGCDLLPEVKNSDHSGAKSLDEVGLDSFADYDCHPGYSLTNVFSVFNPLHKTCLMKGKNGTISAKKEACGSASSLHFRWEGSLLLDIDSHQCLATENVPTAVDVKQFAVMKNCNASDASQQWYCNNLGVSDFLLGITASLPAFLSVKPQTGTAYATNKEGLWQEWIGYHQKDVTAADDLCSFKEGAYKQQIHCYDKGEVMWTPDPVGAVSCKLTLCGPIPTIPNGFFEVLPPKEGGPAPSSRIPLPYTSAVQYFCDKGHECLPGQTTFISRCTDLGHWEPDPTKFPCRPLRCKTFQVPYHAVLVSGSPDQSVYGRKLVITCPSGWMFRPGVFKMRANCNAQGKWDVTIRATTCKELLCDQPPGIPHASISLSGELRYNAVARYTCDEGSWYYPDVNWKETFCQRTGFWDPNPSTFKCIKASCPEPPAIAHTKRDGTQPRGTDGRYAFGSITYLKCSEARKFQDGARKVEILCQEDAKWHPDPFYLECIEIGCPEPEAAVAHSFLSGTDHGIGSKVVLNCENGYRINSHDRKAKTYIKSKCLKTRKWEPDLSTVRCKPILCHDPPLVTNATLLETAYTLDSFAQYVCDAGHWIHPGELVFLSKCMENGTWAPDPSQYKCRVVNCGHPGTFESALDIALPSGSTDFKDVAVLSCQKGFWVTGSFLHKVPLTCNQDGVWQPNVDMISCAVVKCWDPGVLPLSYVNVSTNTDKDFHDEATGGSYYPYATQLTYTCERGFQFAPKTPSVTTTCDGDGQWTLDVTSMACTGILCDAPTGILHGRVVINKATSTNGYVVGSTVTYECHKGHWFARSVYTLEATCTINGKWDKDLESITCIRVTCSPAPSVKGMSMVATGNTASDTAVYACLNGYNVKPTDVMFCNETGFWEPNPSLLHCEVTHCEEPPMVLNADFDLGGASKDFPLDTTIKIKCKKGFFMIPGVDEAEITCDKHSEWDGANVQCLRLEDFDCPLPTMFPNSRIIYWGVRMVTHECLVGYQFVPSKTLTNNFTCGPDDKWTPDTSKFRCEAVTCTAPTPGRRQTISAPASKYDFAARVTVVCDKGYRAVVSDKHPLHSNRSADLTCTKTGEWFPDPSDVVCEDLKCGVPPEIPNANITHTEPTGAKDSVDLAVYACNRNMAFSTAAKTFQTHCSMHGTWEPSPFLARCSYYKCTIPTAPLHSVLTVQSEPAYPGESETLIQIIGVHCKAGYLIRFENGSHAFSINIRCNETGQWGHDVSEVKCEPVHCDDPPNIPGTSKSVLEMPGQKAGMQPYRSTVLYSCPEGSWFSPENITTRLSQCSWDGEWHPKVDSLQCQKILCSYPPHIAHSMLESGNTLTPGSTWVYKCQEGYQFGRGVYKRSRTCKSDGSWSPRSENMICKAIHCPLPSPIPNAEPLRGIRPDMMELGEGAKFLYRCKKGFWISDGPNKHRATEVTCRHGRWLPEPLEIVRCVIVVCDIPPLVKGARVNGDDHLYGAKVTYQCSVGQHFPLYRRKKLVSKCEADGRWVPDISHLSCEDVLCEELDVPGSERQGDRLEMSATVQFTCPDLAWIEKGTRKLSSTCDSDGRWQPPIAGKSCTGISCGVPSLENSLVLETNFSYTRHVKLRCAPGYNMHPAEFGFPLLKCDINGDWNPDPGNYRCDPITCDPPRFMSHAFLSDGGTKFNDTLRVKCEPGYHFRVLHHYVDVTCLEEGMWSEDVSTMKCVPFQCGVAPTIEHSTHATVGSIAPPQYGSEIQYDCQENYWIDRNTHSVTVRCNESGVWDPLKEFKCSEIVCPRPPMKANARVQYPNGTTNSSKQRFGTHLEYHCDSAFWISVQHSLMEWSFSGDRSVDIKCNKSGHWEPNPWSFACRAILAGPIPIGMREGLSLVEVTSADWERKAKIMPTDVRNSPYKTAISTGDAKWVDGKSLVESRIQSLIKNDTGVKAMWDSDLETAWIPVLRKSRQYTVIIYLGGLHIVNGIEMTSEATEASASSVWTFEIIASSDGRHFKEPKMSFQMGDAEERSIIDVNEESVSHNYSSNIEKTHESAEDDYLPEYLGKSMRRIITAQKSPDMNGMRFEGFSIPALFVQLTVTATRDIGTPPIVQDVNFHLSPAKWTIVYPTDIWSCPSLVVLTFLSFITIYIISYYWDVADRHIVHVGWNPDLQYIVPEEYFHIRIQFQRQKNVKSVIFRVVTEQSCSDLICITRTSKTRGKMIVLIPTAHSGQLRRLDLGFVSGERPFDEGEEKAPAVVCRVRVAQVAMDECIFGSMQWSGSEKKLGIMPNVPCSVNWCETGGSGNVKEPGIGMLPYRIVLNHLFSSIFASDFLTQTTRQDRTALAFLGCFIGFAVSGIMLTFGQDLNTTCLLAALEGSAISGICVAALMLIFAKCPIFPRKCEFEAEENDPTKTGKFRRGRGEDAIEETDLKNLVKEFKRCDDSGNDLSLAAQMQSKTTLLTEDSLLLPRECRKPPVAAVFDREVASINDEQLESAFCKRTTRTIRRTRSCYAVMEYTSSLRGTRSKLSNSCPGGLSEHSIDDRADVASCLSMWSRSTVGRAWHKLHKSLDTPVEKLFFSDGEKFSWHDPTYKRIPSDALLPKDSVKVLRKDDGDRNVGLQYPSNYRLPVREDVAHAVFAGALESLNPFGRLFVPDTMGRPHDTQDVRQVTRRTVKISPMRQNASVMQPSGRWGFIPSKNISEQFLDDEDSLVLGASISKPEVMESLLSEMKESALQTGKVDVSVKNVVIAYPAQAAYKVSNTRRILRYLVLGLLLCSAITSVYFGVTEVESTSCYLGAYIIMMSIYVSLVLCLEAVVRFFTATDRIRMQNLLS